MQSPPPRRPTSLGRVCCDGCCSLWTCTSSALFAPAVLQERFVFFGGQEIVGGTRCPPIVICIRRRPSRIVRPSRSAVLASARHCSLQGRDAYGPSRAAYHLVQRPGAAIVRFMSSSLYTLAAASA